MKLTKYEALTNEMEAEGYSVELDAFIVCSLGAEQQRQALTTTGEMGCSSQSKVFERSSVTAIDDSERDGELFPTPNMNLMKRWRQQQQSCSRMKK